VPVNLLDTVRGSLTREIVTFHHTGVATPLTGPHNVNTSNPIELLDGDRRTNLKIRRAAELTNKPLRLATGLLNRLDTCSSTLL
jgi:hypothetical protein